MHNKYLESIVNTLFILLLCVSLTGAVVAYFDNDHTTTECHCKRKHQYK